VPTSAALDDEFRQLNSVHAGHLIVHQAQIESRPLFGAQGRQSRGAGFRRDHLDAQRLEMLLKYCAIAGVVVDDERAQAGEVHSGQARQGRYRVGDGLEPHSNQKVEPRFTSLRTPISPPIRAASCRQIARPRPVPPYLRRRERIGLAERVKYMSLRLLG